MKLHSIVSVGVMALAAAAFADGEYTDGKVCGWMRIDSTLPITAVGVPWVDVGNPANNVKVADLVKTDNLTTDDKLYVYNNGTWLFYQLNSSKEWVAGSTANSSVTPVTAGEPDTATIARGQALYLERSSYSDPFYVYGADGAAIASTTLTGATKYLVASPKAEAFQVVNAKISGATAKTRRGGDQIIVPLDGGNTRIYTLVNSKWGYVGADGRVEEGAAGYLPVPLGTGVWYVTGSADNSITITW